MSQDAFNKLEGLLENYDKMCEKHFINNNQQTLVLITDLQNSINNFKIKTDVQPFKHNHTLSKVEEVDNEDQEQSQFQVLQEDRDETDQQIIIQDQIE